MFQLIASEVAHLASSLAVQKTADALEEPFTGSKNNKRLHRIAAIFAGMEGPDLDWVTDVLFRAYLVAEGIGKKKLLTAESIFSYQDITDGLGEPLETIGSLMTHRSPLTHTFFPGIPVAMALGYAAYGLAARGRPDQKKQARYGAFVFAAQWSLSHLFIDMTEGYIFPYMGSDTRLELSTRMLDIINTNPALANLGMDTDDMSIILKGAMLGTYIAGGILARKYVPKALEKVRGSKAFNRLMLLSYESIPYMRSLTFV